MSQGRKRIDSKKKGKGGPRAEGAGVVGGAEDVNFKDDPILVKDGVMAGDLDSKE